RTDRGDHRRSPAARRAPRILVGDAAQPAGENAAARSLSRSGLHRNAAGGREEREVQEDAGEAVSARRLPVITAHAAPRSVPGIDWYRIRQANLNHFPDTALPPPQFGTQLKKQKEKPFVGGWRRCFGRHGRLGVPRL